MRLRVFFIAFACLILAGCGGVTAQYRMTFDTTDPQQRTALLEASKRVVERRISRLSPKPITLSPEDQEDGTVLLTIELYDEDIEEELTQELLAPFSLSIMLQQSGSGGDLFVEEQGWFTKTGITEKSVTWVRAGEEPDGKGTVTIELTPEGRALLEETFNENIGGMLGLFVRKHLMSKMPIDDKGLRESIVIAGIPSPEIAAIFADDVNTGIHVQFSLP
jgi:hypothetical protein